MVVYSGDGDLFAIGGNHLIHAARRNIDLKVICVNNLIYAMTGGQTAPTTPGHSTTSTNPYGTFEPSFNLPHLVEAAGAVYVARWTTFHVRQLARSISEVFQKKGFSFIEVISPCPTLYQRRNKMGDGLDTMKYYKEKSKVRNGAPTSEVGLDPERRNHCRQICGSRPARLPDDDARAISPSHWATDSWNREEMRMQLTEIRVAGFGGQGVILSAIVIGKAASIYQGGYATMTQNFGPEARGGACSAQLILSDTPILYPYVTRPDILVVMSQEAYVRFAPELKEGGILIVEQDMVRVGDLDKGVQVYSIPATRIAEELGKRMVLNSVMVGFFTAVTNLLGAEAVREAVADSVPKSFLELNLKAFDKGLQYGAVARTVPASSADAELQLEYAPE